MSSGPIDSRLVLEESATPKSWSIVFRLALLFTVSAAVMLFFAMATAYWAVVKHVDHDNDRYLTDKLAAIRADIAVDAGPQSLDRELKIVRAADKIYAARVIDASGAIVAESPRMRTLLPVDIFPTSFSPEGRRPRTAIYRARDGKVFGLITAQASFAEQKFTVQLAQERTHDERFRARYAGLLTGMAICAVVMCAGVALLVTRRGLLPLKRLAESIDRVGATHFHERVPLATWPEELQPLARAFNKMLARLNDSFTRLSQFSADLAHELRTPIAILRGEAEGALTKARTPEEYREVIGSGLEELQRLSGMIDNLLFLARAETIGDLKRSYFDGRAAIDKVREFYEAVSQEQGVEIRCQGEGEVYAEPVLFRRALINLITNALRFTPAGGQVTVSLEHGPEGSDVAVADTGCGIPSEQVENVFDRFFRGDAARHAAGTGLGLSIVKSIMEIHSGSVSLESEQGKGTTVRLQFPDRNGAEPA